MPPRPALAIPLLLLFAMGCSEPSAPAPLVRGRPEVTVVASSQRTIARTSGQPGFIEAYEQTSMYPVVSGFIDVWNVDIGDEITRGMVLAQLDVPQLIAEHEEKQAELELDEVRVRLAEELVRVATENAHSATAQVAEAQANLGKYEADVELQKVEYKRISELVRLKSVQPILEDESRKRLQTSVATLEAGKSSVVVAKANEAARQADVARTQVDVEAARARTKVARAAEKRLAALVRYTSIRAPYDGVVVDRNVNTGDFVQPSGGEQAGLRILQAGSRPGASVPLYIVARTDKVRILLDVPEMEASGVGPGNKAWVTIQALGDEIEAHVIRTSWSLNVKTRTLRVEVDIPNAGRRILPGMYAFGRVELKRSHVWTVPLESLVEFGNQTSFYAYQDGRAVLVPVQRGIDDGAWVEITRKRIKGHWVPCDGSEQVIVGDLSQISDGELVRPDSSSPIQPTEQRRDALSSKGG